jgi:hypothetical protein
MAHSSHAFVPSARFRPAKSTESDDPDRSWRHGCCRRTECPSGPRLLGSVPGRGIPDHFGGHAREGLGGRVLDLRVIERDLPGTLDPAVIAASGRDYAARYLAASRHGTARNGAGADLASADLTSAGGSQRAELGATRYLRPLEADAAFVPPGSTDRPWCVRVPTTIPRNRLDARRGLADGSLMP